MIHSRISVDEGGLRHQAGQKKRYVPFASIVDVELRPRFLGSPAIALTLVDASREPEVIFVGPAALEIHRELVTHLEARRAHVAVPTPVGWRREGRSLVQWISSLERTAEGSYREGATAGALASSVVDDANADIEARAAAIHVLVLSAEGSALVSVAKVLLGRSLPPIVQIAAGLAAGGSAFVTPDVIAEATSFLDPSDGAALSGIRYEVTASKAHVTAAAAAKRDLEEEARRVTSSSRPHHATRSVAGSDRDTSRWIGRSWGL